MLEAIPLLVALGQCSYGDSISFTSTDSWFDLPTICTEDTNSSSLITFQSSGYKHVTLKPLSVAVIGTDLGLSRSFQTLACFITVLAVERTHEESASL